MIEQLADNLYDTFIQRPDVRIEWGRYPPW